MVSAVFISVFVLVCIGVADVKCDQDEDIPHNEVKNWALKFGVDLWEFGRQFTKMNEIQRKYHDDPLEVVRKDGLILIREMASEVKNMMDFKMSAVKRIMDSAEQAALSSPESGDVSAQALSRRTRSGDGPVTSQAYQADNGGNGGQWTHSDHFDGRRVNTTRSELLTPADVSADDPAVHSAVSWSSHLEPLFANNYEIDPGLSWQYFGSSAGVLRRFPATDRGGKPADINDFRNTRWFIEAATSPKDVVILLDVTSYPVTSSSLPGASVSAILDALGDDDFVNVFAYSADLRPAAPCLGGGLVSAHSDNKRVLLGALNGPKEQWGELSSKGDLNLSKALEFGFDVLYRYNRSGQGCQCNQALVLVSANVPEAPRGVFQKHNWPHMPVRVFTFDTGRDKTTAAEMHWIACNNKGFYSKISSAGDARRKVLDFIAVMARPMVMYQNDHPIQWSAVYVGAKDENGVDRLMTSVSTPVFDRRNHTVRVANLLGVVGTDVPVDQIKKLVPEYKLGVNGYSFIVNNNGHVLYHPELKPRLGKTKYTDTLKPTYTSVDLTEVELPESETSPRENHTALLDLRKDMIEQKEGETELGVKVRYDLCRRVSTRRHKYFYNPIEGSPFSLGVALPEGYGMYELRAELEIRHSALNVTEYFKGTNWRVHPDWVYCEYGSSSEQRFSNGEERLLHFLSRAGRPGWKWMSMRPRASAQEHKRSDKEAYYCDKTLLQSLVRDAMVTDGLDRRGARQSTHKEDKQQGYQMFGVSLSFVATRSGLLRWTEHGPGANTQDNAPADSPGMRFAAKHPRPTEATWYRRAVDQHSQEPESFVFSVDFADEQEQQDGDDGKDGSSGSGGPVVTVAHAVFVEHKGHRAPAAVVGLQFKHAALAGHFVNITSACTGSSSPSGCRKTCASEELDCYLLDNNGFVLLSEDSTHTGRFFGEIDGTIMDSLVQDRIFKRVAVFDYQGTCIGDPNRVAGSSERPLSWFASWLTRWFVTWFKMTSLFDLVQTVTARAQYRVPDYDEQQKDLYLKAKPLQTDYLKPLEYPKTDYVKTDFVKPDYVKSDYPKSDYSKPDYPKADYRPASDYLKPDYVKPDYLKPPSEYQAKKDYDKKIADDYLKKIDFPQTSSSYLPQKTPNRDYQGDQHNDYQGHQEDLTDDSIYDDYDDDDDDTDFDYPPDSDLDGDRNRDDFDQDGHFDHGDNNGRGGNTQFETATKLNNGAGGGGGNGGHVVKDGSSPGAPGGGGGGAGRPCDLRTDLYVLQPERLNTSGQNNPLKGKLTNCHVTGCERPFSVQKIPHSNLILLVVDTLCPCGSKQLHIRSVEVSGGPGGAAGGGTPHQPPECARYSARQHLFRRRPPKCINYHPEEIEIQQCGAAGSLVAHAALVSLAAILATLLLTTT